MITGAMSWTGAAVQLRCMFNVSFMIKLDRISAFLVKL